MTPSSSLMEQIHQWLREDIGDGDHTTLSTIPASAEGSARLLVKQEGILAGAAVAGTIFHALDPDLSVQYNRQDGDAVRPGDTAFHVSGNVRSILQSERLVLNVMQRMSGIATQTSAYVKRVEGTGTRILDTRKTTPGFRAFEKEAVRIGGGVNHRSGLYDMILIKDNHIDFAGGIRQAIERSRSYLAKKKRDLKIVVETRSLEDIRSALDAGGIHRVLLDNFSVEQTGRAVELINHAVDTESSGGITLENLRDYALCGVDYISVGALTHQVKSLDLSLKAEF